MLETCSPSAASGLFRFVHVYGNCQLARTAKSVMHTHRFYLRRLAFWCTQVTKFSVMILVDVFCSCKRLLSFPGHSVKTTETLQSLERDTIKLIEQSTC